MSESKVTKKQLATATFEAMLAKREAGEFETNKAFRAACIQAFQDELEVSGSSACTMYNTNKKRAMEEDPTLGLGRDPKKEKTKVKAKGKTEADGEVAPVVLTGVPAETVTVEVDPTKAVEVDPIEMLSDGIDHDYEDIAEFTGGFDTHGGDYM